MGMAKKAPILLVSVVLAFVVVFAQIPIFTVAAASPPGEAERAEALIGIAKKASLRIETLLNETKTMGIDNSIITKAEDLYGEGNALLSQAEVAIQERNYGEVVNLTISAMERFREARMVLAPVFKQNEEVEKFVMAQGLLVAANRTLERIERLEKSLSEAQENLNRAKSLLNADELTALLQKGNVSEVAHRIAEANRLISQTLKSIAEEAASKRMERFMERLQERYESLIDKLQKAGVNVTEFLNNTGFKNKHEFQERVQHLKDAIKAAGPGNAKGLMGQLMSLANGLKKLERKGESNSTAPSGGEGTPALSVEIKGKKAVGNFKMVLLDVVIKNIGDVRLRFQNSAYGLTIERKGEGGTWEFYYSPISAQVIVFLEPAQTAHVTMILKQPQPGEYRVHVQGFYGENGQTVEAVAEFTLP
jgi:tetratricopeptide (TPR) repeat protein